jgi:ABC-type spermidine/putrescine transport system permease subunit I
LRVTTVDHAPDWKVTVGYRVMLAVGWGSLILAAYVAVVAVVLGLPTAWWIAGGLALGAIGTVVFLPEPVPAEMIVGGRNHIDPRRPG